jgi:uncharacterized damage-inducible protein DinB
MHMAASDAKHDLHRYLQAAREVLVWKLEGLSEYDIRRPLVYSGTNLLGVLKHVALVESGYLGATFDRPFEEAKGWLVDSDEPNADMWATVDESRDQLVGFYQRVWDHSDATVAALPLEAIGHVPWWPQERREATLHHILIRMTAETNRHAGHADIVRELIDNSIGGHKGNEFVPSTDPAWWQDYRARLEGVARQADQQARQR